HYASAGCTLRGFGSSAWRDVASCRRQAYGGQVQRLPADRLVRKNYALGESTNSLRARKLLNRRCASVQEPVLQLKDSKQPVFKLFLSKSSRMVRRSRGDSAA